MNKKQTVARVAGKDLRRNERYRVDMLCAQCGGPFDMGVDGLTVRPGGHETPVCDVCAGAIRNAAGELVNMREVRAQWEGKEARPKTGVQAWVCPECNQVVGVVNVGQPQVTLCSACKFKRDRAVRIGWYQVAATPEAVLGQR